MVDESIEAPLISVIVAAKNGAAYLGECLESIFTSTYRPIEVILVDGGSTDATREIARSFTEVRIVEQRGTGISDAYNRGIEAASGPLIAFLSHDDRWVPDKLRLQEQRLRSQPEIGLVGGKASFFLDCSLSEPPAGFRSELLESPSEAWIVETILVRRAVFERVGPFDERFSIAGDVDWISRARDAGIPMEALEDIVVHKRVHGGNASLSRDNSRQLVTVLKRSIDRKRRAREHTFLFPPPLRRRKHMTESSCVSGERTMLRNLLGLLKGGPTVERSPQVERQLQLAWAVLIWQTMLVDEVLERSEEAKAVQMLARGLEIEVSEAESLLREANTMSDREDLRDLMDAVVKHLTKADRERIVKAMVEVAKADGELEVGEAAVLDFVSKRFGVKL